MKFPFSNNENYLLKSLILPFVVLWQHKVEFFIWLMFVIMASQIGVIINLIYRMGFLEWDFSASLGPESSSGVFYTFSLVMISSLIGPLFIRFIKNEEPLYRNITMVYITLLIFTLLFCAVYYVFSTSTTKNVEYSKMTNENMDLDKPQLFFFVLAIVFSLYSFGLSLMRDHEKDLHMSDDYLEKENRTKERLADDDSGAKEDNQIKLDNGKILQV